MSEPVASVFSASFAGPTSKNGSFSLAAGDHGIRLEFRSSEPTLCSSEQGFVEGLWRFDCGELFLLQPTTGKYLEINLAPNGAWWSCVFSGVRVRDGETLSPQLEHITADYSENGWRASFDLSWREIERCLGSAENLLGNVTLILGGCPDANPPLENLHSIAKLGAVDFHRPHEWLALKELLT